MRFFDRLLNLTKSEDALSTRAELQSVWNAYSSQWPDDNDRYSCWKRDILLPAPKETIKQAMRLVYADLPKPVDWVSFAAFFVEFVDLATYFPDDKYSVIQSVRRSRLIQFGAESARDPLLMFKVVTGTAMFDTPENWKENIINIRDRLKRSAAWDPVDLSDNDVQQIRQILLECAIERATLATEWQLYILSIGADKFVADR